MLRHDVTEPSIGGDVLTPGYFAARACFVAGRWKFNGCQFKVPMTPRLPVSLRHKLL